MASSQLFLALAIFSVYLVGASSAATEDALLKWLTNHGAKADVTISSKDGRRGVFAAKDFKDDEVIARIPLALATNLGPSAQPHYVADYELLRRMHTDPAFNATYGPLIATWPPAEELFMPEQYSDEHVDLLQSEPLEEVIQQRREAVVEAYEGKLPDVPSINDALRPHGKHVSLAEFIHIAALTASRIFNFGTPEHEDALYLLPLADLIAHDDEAPNAIVNMVGNEFHIIAIDDILEGEEIRHHFLHDVVHRNDLSLLAYGFIQQREWPLLCAQDLPGHHDLEEWPTTPADDDEYIMGSHAGDEDEADRLADILDSFPTTQEEDEALLQGGTITDWRSKLLVEFRVERKKALRLAIEQLLESEAEL